MDQSIYSDEHVSITPTLAVIEGTTYAVQTINSIRVVEQKPKGIWVKGLMVALGAPVGFLAASEIRNGYPEAGLILLLAACIAMAPGVIAALKPKRYTLLLRTSSGEMDAITGQDKRYLEQLRLCLEVAIASAVEVRPVGLAAANAKDCPRCAETIKAAATACRFCGYEFQVEAEGLR
ncbi:hypothetical protein GAY28_10105 [Azospirillum brasilense]|nr:hypothetical protein [Azospirillum brasilense]